ncbi:FRA10AC1-like protein [Drosera capensis]
MVKHLGVLPWSAHFPISLPRLAKPDTPPPLMASLRSLKSSIYDREERKQKYQANVRGINAFDRHRKFVDDYVRYYGKGAPSGLNYPIKTDQDTLREGYRFVLKRMTMIHHGSKVLSNIGLRWRTEKEGSLFAVTSIVMKKITLQVNFSYIEAGESKQALVKLVACERCAEKLHNRRMKEKEKLERAEQEQPTRKGYLLWFEVMILITNLVVMKRYGFTDIRNSSFFEGIAKR